MSSSSSKKHAAAPTATRVQPTLQLERDLLALPRDELAKIDAWIASGLEAQAQAWVRDAIAELGHDPGLIVSFVVQDDVHRGQDDRDRVDFRFRFEDHARIERGLATIMLWLSEEAGPERFEVAKRRLRASLYRTAYQRKHGFPGDLAAMLKQEGLALKFSGWPWHTDAAKQAEARRIIATASLVKYDFGAAFAILFGDEAAKKLGHAALGCPKYAAWDVAVLDAADPVAALRV